MITKEGFIRIVNFITPWAGVWLYRSHSENALFLQTPSSLLWDMAQATIMYSYGDH